MKFGRRLRLPIRIRTTVLLRVSAISTAILVAFYFGILSASSSKHIVVTRNEKADLDERPQTDLRLHLDNVKLTRYLYNAGTSSSQSKKVKINGLGYTYKTSTSLGITDAKRCSYFVSHPADGIVPHGIVFTITITARDSYGRQRTSGGDIWSVLLQSATSERTSTIGKTIDHGSGTYTSYIFSGWQGNSTVHVTLLFPAEAVALLEKKLLHSLGNSIYRGVFQKNNKTEKSMCTVQHGGSWKDKCEYFSPNILYGTRLLCDKPPSLPCSALTNIPRGQAPTTDAKLKGLFQRKLTHQTVTTGPSYINVIGHPFAWRPIKLPPCQPDIPQPVSDGYWYGGEWNSLVCRSTIRSIPEYLECLHNTSVYFLGDSILQQRALALLGVLNVTHNENFHKMRNASLRSESGYNISLIFQPHPFTSEKKSSDILLSSSGYEAEMMDSLSNNQSKTIILIGPSYHFKFWQIEAYREYLEHLREAAVQFLGRMPFGKIVLISPQFLSEDYKLLPIYQRMHRLQREVFERSGVHFMDVYDLEQAVTWDKKQHISPQVLKEEMYLFLSLVC